MTGRQGTSHQADPGDVVAIVVNYNGGDAVLECVRSLREQTRPPAEIIVVDNASTDGSLAAVRAAHPAARIIENDYNAGWGVACNIGINASRGRYVALVNNDAHLDARCIAEMVRHIETADDYGACASKILLWDQPELIEVAGLVMYRDGTSVGRGRLRPATLYDRVEEVFCANDCCCLYRREMLEHIGLYDPDFFIYCDETDIGWRQQLAGWKCIYAPSAVAYHLHSRAAGDYSDFKAYHVERNRLFLCMKYYAWPDLVASFGWATWRYVIQVWLSLRGRGALGHYRKEHSLLHGLGILARAHVDALRKWRVMRGRRRAFAPRRVLSRRDVGRLFERFGVSAAEIAGYE